MSAVFDFLLKLFLGLVVLTSLVVSVLIVHLVLMEEKAPTAELTEPECSGTTDRREPRAVTPMTRPVCDQRSSR